MTSEIDQVANVQGPSSEPASNETHRPMAVTSDGYWLVASDGGIFTFGDAGYHGSEPGAGVAVGNIIGIVSSPSGDGYWMEGSDGRVSAFGDASPEGSMLGMHLNKPIVGIASVSISQTSPPPPTPPPVTTTPPLTITTTVLPNATLGTSYSAALTASGGTTPYVWTITSGSLPAGLNLSSNGAITGTPSNPGNSTFAVRVTDATTPTERTATASFSLSVSGALLVITTSSLPSATVGTAYSASLTASGGTLPYSWSVTSGSLPPGLSLSPTGAISGTPSTQGSSSFTVEVTDSSTPSPQVATATLSISVTPAPTADSPNWSGYVVPSSTQLLTETQGHWTVPTLDCAATPNAGAAIWVGIGGWSWPTGGTSGVLLQTGVTTECVSGAQQDAGWWEEYPSSPNQSVNFASFPVSPGDSIQAWVYEDSNGAWETRVDNLTTGLSGIMVTGEGWGVTSDGGGGTFTEQGSTAGLSYSGGYTAEWIVEDFSQNGAYVPFADYGTVAFSGLTTSLPSWSLTSNEGVEIVQGGTVLSTPSPPSGGGFSVSYSG